MCECILNCDKLQYQLEDFWVECFVLIRHIIGGVDYKGVREIMKVTIKGKQISNLYKLKLINDCRDAKKKLKRFHQD